MRVMPESPPPPFPASDRFIVRSRTTLPLGEQLVDVYCDALYHLDSALDLARNEHLDKRFAAVRGRLEQTFAILNSVIKDFAD